MPRNGSGTYNLPAGDWNPPASGAVIDAAGYVTQSSDIASALTQSISKDGQTQWTNIDDHGGFRITNVSDGVGSTDVMTYGQGAKLAGGNTFTGTQTFTNQVVLSGSLAVTSVAIFTGPVTMSGAVTISSVASVNVLNVASVASLNNLTVASVAAVKTLNVSGTGSVQSLVVGAASGGAVASGINTSFLAVNGTQITGNGKVVQVVNTQTGTAATGTTVIPVDNSKPQNTEGDQYMTLAITPTNSANHLKIDVVFNWALSTGLTDVTAALFQDSTADALAVAGSSLGSSSAGHLQQITFSYYMTAGTTSATTFKVRAGPASASTLTFNGSAGSGLFNGLMASSITITEYN